MQGSYILLVAVGIIILIGGAKRFLASIKIKVLTATLLIIAVTIGNIFAPVIWGIELYIGSIIFILACLVFVFSSSSRIIWGSLVSISAIVVLLIIYQINIIDRYSLTEFMSIVMIIAIISISSYIISSNSGQAFVVAFLAGMFFQIIYLYLDRNVLVIGNDYAFNLAVYSAFASVALNEGISAIVSEVSDQTPDLSFEAGEIDDSTSKDSED